MDVMSHPLATPALHIRDPRKPLPPATTTFFLTVEAMLHEAPYLNASFRESDCKYWLENYREG